MPGDELHEELRGAIDDARRLQDELEQFERAMAAELAADEAAEAAEAAAAATAAEVTDAEPVAAEPVPVDEPVDGEPAVVEPVAVAGPPRRRRRVLAVTGPAVLLALALAGWSLGLRPAALADRVRDIGARSVAGQAVPADRAEGVPAAPVAGQGCVPLTVVAASAVAGALREVAAGLTGGPDCADVRVVVADGRRAGAAALAAGADVWVPDDEAWAGSAPDGLLPVVEAGAKPAAGPVLASSPLLLVADRTTADRLTAAGGGWRALERLVGREQRLRLVAADPQSSADGLLALGGLGEVVWIADGMDASAAALSALSGRTRTVAVDGLRPAAAGEVAVVPELRRPAPSPGQRLLVPRDRTVLLRFSWLVTRAGLADPARAAALQRFAAALTGAPGVAAFTAAGLRGPDGRRFPAVATASATASATAPPALPGVPDRLPPALPVLDPHHVDHVFATWYPADRAVDLLVVVDVSRSMARIPDGSDQELITLVKQGCLRVAGLLPDRAGLGVWALGHRLDGDNDFLPLVDPGPLDRAQRRRVRSAVDGLVTRQTSTGLYDTVLAAYRSAVSRARPGVPAQVLVFTDGRDESDPGSIGAAGLARELAAVQASQPAAIRVSLGVLAYGDADRSDLERAVAPVGGYVDRVRTPGEVADAFLHLAAGGLHG